mmetsp:Transcript_22157/g.50721  ORF Transcript_22157/g.50721 Transcript_22157/m.50721 type:complete len:99 (-) Transcript_22157:896-1192(-)
MCLLFRSDYRPDTPLAIVSYSRKNKMMQGSHSAIPVFILMLNRQQNMVLQNNALFSQHPEKTYIRSSTIASTYISVFPLTWCIGVWIPFQKACHVEIV